MKTIGVILSGGQSRRMGRDKARLDFGGRPMLTHLVETYRPFFDKIFVSVNQAGRFDTAGAGEIVDRRPGLGPLAALESMTPAFCPWTNPCSPPIPGAACRR